MTHETFSPHPGRGPAPSLAKGGGAAGVATIGVAGVEVVQNVLADTQSAVLPLVPYLDTLRWVFIAMALAGIAVAIFARWDDRRKGLR